MKRLLILFLSVFLISAQVWAQSGSSPSTDYSALYAGSSTDGSSRGNQQETDTSPAEASEGSAAVTVPSAESSAALPVSRIRYSFEHNMLPRYFYDDPENMLEVIDDIGLYTLWESVSTENGALPTYPKADYIPHWYTSDQGDVLLQMELPKPDANTLCYRIYFVTNVQSGEAGYYTAESDDFDPDACFICMWTRELEHVNFGAVQVPDPESSDYESALQNEVSIIAQLFGITAPLSPAEGYGPDLSGEQGAGDPGETGSTENAYDSGSGTDRNGSDIGSSNSGTGGSGSDPGIDHLALVECPQLGFTTRANPAYSWDYQEGTGISIYTQREGSIPYAIIYRAEDRIMEPFDYIKEQFTPHMQQQYGADLVSYVEYEVYEIGGKRLPAGLYTYRVGNYLVEMLRLYDSTGDRTCAYTAKYLSGEGEPTLAALDTAIRHLQTQ